MLKQAKIRRLTVTVEDNRAVLMLAQVRPMIDVAKVSHENFVRNALKDRLGIPRTEPAPQCIKEAAQRIGKQLTARDVAAKIIKEGSTTKVVDFVKARAERMNAGVEPEAPQAA